MAFVIGDDCVMCGTCAANCPAEAISEGNGKYVINADSCMECGTCAANCPVGAISGTVKQPHTIDVNKCIKCGACVKKCPVHARYYDSYNYLYHKEELELGFARRAEPALFF